MADDKTERATMTRGPDRRPEEGEETSVAEIELETDAIASGLGAERVGRVENRGGYFGAVSTAAQVAALHQGLPSNHPAPINLAEWIDIIPPEDFSPAVHLLRTFFSSQRFLEVPTQHLMRPPLCNLAACENPDSIVAVDFLGKKCALPQTGQMWLEDFLLRNPNKKYQGIFCVSYSYRAEQHPQKGRHNIIFPMFEFEMHGSHEALRALECRLLGFLGIADDKEIYTADYKETAQKYGVREIEDAEERRLWDEHGHAVLLSFFPEYTSPFWNMKRRPDGTSEKTDCLLYGIETIGSAERSPDAADMWKRFHTISDGKYAAKLFELFGEKEVLEELNYFLGARAYPSGHIVRSGGGIGITRMIRALKLAGKI